MRTSITIVLAAVFGLVWYWTAPGVRMPYWVMVVLIMAAVAGGNLAGQASDRRIDRRKAARRADVSKSWNGTRETKT